MKQGLADILAALARARRVVITAHERPDGDALGAALGLRRILVAAGKTARVLGLSPVASRYAFLEQAGELEPVRENWLQDAELFIALDCGAFDRLGEFARDAVGRIPVINIDHHDSNTRFGDLNWVDANASSTGEMIYRLAREGNYAVSCAAAEALWVALVTDTGRFSYENTSPAALRIGADLVESGVNPAVVERQVFQSIELKEYQLMSRALASLRLHENGKIATLALTREDFAACDCGPQNAQDIVNIGRSVASVEAAFFFYELPLENSTKVSVRTVPPLDASALCREFGGGGHHRAAGCALLAPLRTTMDKILATAHAHWYNEQPSSSTPFRSC